MIKNLRIAIEYIGFGLIVLGFIITFATLRAKGFSYLILGTGILLIVTPLSIYLLFQKFKGSNNEDMYGKYIADLKRTGIRIPVDLTRCLVKSNNWVTEVARYDNPRVEFFNEISGHSDKNIEKVESHISQIEYKCEFQDRKRAFVSPTIAKDKTTLQLLMEMQKETAIYVDRDDNRYYYFDLEFLDR